MGELSSFEGVDVIHAKIEIPDAAGGLREAMAVEPVELHHGDEVHVVLHCRVKKVRFDPAAKDNTDELTRVHVFETLDAAFIESDAVADHVRANVDRVRKLVEEQKGIQRLDDVLAEDDDEEAAAEQGRAHEAGLHHGVTVEGCPACVERDADRKADKPKRADLA